MDANGLFRNPSPSEDDLTGARQQKDCDQEAVPGWHALAYLVKMVNSSFEEPNQGEDEESDKSQVIDDVQEDLLVLHKLQHILHRLSYGERQDLSPNNTIPLGEWIVILVVARWSQAYNSKA